MIDKTNISMSIIEQPNIIAKVAMTLQYRSAPESLLLYDSNDSNSWWLIECNMLSSSLLSSSKLIRKSLGDKKLSSSELVLKSDEVELEDVLSDEIELEDEIVSSSLLETELTVLFELLISRD